MSGKHEFTPKPNQPDECAICDVELCRHEYYAYATPRKPMTPSLSDLIQRVRALDKAATPGPWIAETKWYETGPDHDLVSGPHTPQTQLSRYLSNSFSREADLVLCAESRTLLVQLADAAERMQEQVETLRSERDENGQKYWHLRGEMAAAQINHEARVAELEGQIADLKGSLLIARGIASRLATIGSCQHPDAGQSPYGHGSTHYCSTCQQFVRFNTNDLDEIQSWAAPSRPDTET